MRLKRDGIGGAKSRLGQLAQVVALLLVMAGALPESRAASAIDITAVVGFGDVFRPGHWTPLNVTVTNRGADIDGELEVQVTGDDALRGRLLVTTHRRTLELNSNARKSLHFVVHPQGLSHPVVVSVRAHGKELAREELDLRNRFAAQRLLLVLSRDVDLDYLNDGSVDGLRVLYPHPELLPAHWRGYDAVAAIVMHGMSLERLSASQFEALKKWIAHGGILAVSGAADYALLRTARLAELLPGTPVGMTRIDASTLPEAFSASPDASRPVHVHRLRAFQGHVRLQVGDVPLIVERALGRGRVLYLTFDVSAHPFDRREGMRALWLENLRLPAISAARVSAADPGTETPLMALIRAQAGRFPASATVFLFLLLYLGVLFAGYAIPMVTPARRWTLALGSWAAPLVFAPAAWLMFGPAVFPRAATAASVALIEPLPGSGYARLTLELGVYANRTGRLRLEYRGAEPVLYAHRQALREGKVQDWVLGEGPRAYAEPSDRRRYALHALQGEDVIAFRVDARVHDESPGPRLVLYNASGRNLEALSMLFDGYAYPLGSIAAGERLERRLVPGTDGVAVTAASWQEALKATPAGAPDLAPARILLQRRLQEAGEVDLPNRSEAMLLAHTTNPVQPTGESANWSHRSQALVALRISPAAAEPLANRSPDRH
jgi:hypothetical protein